MKKLFKNLLSSDSWSKHFSETVKRMGKNNAGFSLVELIVVIAIMAILAAVAVVGFSVYIPKAQKAADMSLVDEISDGIVMVGSTDDFNGQTGSVGYVVISDTGLKVYDGALNQITTYGVNAIYDAVVDVMGNEVFSKDNLAYADWLKNIGDIGSLTGSFTGSNFDGNTEALLGDIQNLTNAVEDIGSTTVFENDTEFKAYMDSLEGVDLTDNQVVANYATIYVAESMSGIDDTAKANFVSRWNTANATAYDFVGILDANNQEVISNMGIAAAYYARAEALAAYLSSDSTANAAFFAAVENQRNSLEAQNPGSTEGDTLFTSAATVSAWFASQPIGGESIDDVKENLTIACGALETFAASTGAYTQYFANGLAEKDALAYLDSLKIVNNNKDELTSNIGSDNLYGDGSANSMFTTQVAVGNLLGSETNALMITVKKYADGRVECTCYPTN